MKRSAIAVIGAGLMATLAALAPTGQASSWQYQRTSITVGGSQAATPERIVYEGTTYMPIYYVGGALQSLGMTQSWNGSSHVWTIDTGSGAKPTLSLDAKSGNTTIAVNGQTVARHVVIVQATDPDSGVVTTFMPIWYVQQLLDALGFTTDTWDGAIVPPTWTLGLPKGDPIELKTMVVKTFDAALSIAPDSTGSNPFDDVSAADWGYVHAAVEKGLFAPDSAGHFGAADTVSMHDVDHAYQLYLGIPDAHMAWNAGGNTDAWGADIGLNKGLGTDVDLASLPQLKFNLTALNQGYWQDASGVYHLVFTPYDGYVNYSDGYAPANKLTAADVASGMEQSIKNLDVVTFTKTGSSSDPTWYLRVPGLSDQSSQEIEAYNEGSTNTTYSSIDGGHTWLFDNGLARFDSRDYTSGGSAAPPSTVLVKATGTTAVISTGIVSPDLNHPGTIYVINSDYATVGISGTSTGGVKVKSGLNY